MKQRLDDILIANLQRRKTWYWFACHDGKGSKSGRGDHRDTFETLLMAEYSSKRSDVCGYVKDS